MSKGVDIVNYVEETRKLLRLSASQFADLTGLSYSEMSDILENKIEPSPKLLIGCDIARKKFLRKTNT